MRKILRMKSLPQIVGEGRSTLYEKMQRGESPKPNVRLGSKNVGWTDDLIEVYIEKHIVADGEKVA